MTDKYTDDHDRQWDDALRRFAPLMDVPEPSTLQQARWKQRRSSRRGGTFFKILSGSGALAAAIVLAVVITMNATARPLSARVIFDDLRAAMNGSMLLTFDNIDIDFSRLNYRHTDRRVTFDGQIFADAIQQLPSVHRARTASQCDQWRPSRSRFSHCRFGGAQRRVGLRACQ